MRIQSHTDVICVFHRFGNIDANPEFDGFAIDYTHMDTSGFDTLKVVESPQSSSCPPADVSYENLSPASPVTIDDEPAEDFEATFDSDDFLFFWPENRLEIAT